MYVRIYFLGLVSRLRSILIDLRKYKRLGRLFVVRSNFAGFADSKMTAGDLPLFSTC